MVLRSIYRYEIYVITFLVNSCNNQSKQSDKLWFNSDCRKAGKNYRKAKRLFKHFGSNLFKLRLKQTEIIYKKTMNNSIIKFNRNTLTR